MSDGVFRKENLYGINMAEKHRAYVVSEAQRSMDTDVLIIGGIAGILTAYFLKQSGIDCILLEKGRICQGATSHTTAKIT